MVQEQPVHAVKRNISKYCNIPKELNRFSFRFFHQPHLQIIYLHDVQKLQGGEGFQIIGNYVNRQEESAPTQGKVAV